MPTERPQLISAMATPLRADFTPHHELLLAHSRNQLADGCDGVAVLGTSGEGPCLAVGERCAALDFLLDEDIPPARLIAGCGAASLADVSAMARHALSVGVHRVLLMPPFFLREAATEDGVFRFYAEVIERAADPKLRLLLYNFPAICGFTLPVPLIARLHEAFGARVHGIKDSGGDWQQTSAYLEAFGQLTIYTGTEVHARRAIALGGVGTICGMGNVVPKIMRRFLDTGDEEEAARLEALINAVGDALCVGPFFPACKAAIAMATGEPDWRRVVPPLASLDEAEYGRLSAALDAIADHHGTPVA